MLRNWQCVMRLVSSGGSEPRFAQLFQIFKSQLKVLGAGRVTGSTFYTEDPLTLGETLKC